MKEVEDGVNLDITPSVILPDEATETPLVRLNITAKSTNPAAAAGNVAVATEGNVVTTEVMVPHETTFVLGGLLDDTRTKESDGIPGLRHVPVLGALFGTESEANTLVETMFFITPKVIMPNEIVSADIAPRRYLQRRQLSLHETAKKLQETSKELGRPNIHEDE